MPVWSDTNATGGTQLWAIWNTTSTSTTTASSVTWNAWNGTNTFTANHFEVISTRAAEARRTGEAERKAANGRARALLRLLLTDEQWSAYEDRRSFVVKAQSGQSYRIKHGYAGNVYLLDDEGREVESLCAHPSMHDEGKPLPVEDAMAAQVLTLTTDEQAFREVANITDYRANRTVRSRRRAA